MRLLQVAALLLATASTAADTARVLHVYVREGCPHCADAKAFLATVAPT